MRSSLLLILVCQCSASMLSAKETVGQKVVISLPSGGDTSYPGVVVDEKQNRLWVSYYSSHEGKAAIYLAALRLDVLMNKMKNGAL